jgi:hypothetical protein
MVSGRDPFLSEEGPVFRPEKNRGVYEFKHRGEINALVSAAPTALLSASSTVRVWDSSGPPRDSSAVHYDLGSTMSGGSRLGRAISSVMRGRVAALRITAGVTAIACFSSGDADQKQQQAPLYAVCGTSEGAVHVVKVDPAPGDAGSSTPGPGVIAVRDVSASAIISIVIEGAAAGEPWVALVLGGIIFLEGAVGFFFFFSSSFFFFLSS